jgi:hypothetical protein
MATRNLRILRDLSDPLPPRYVLTIITVSAVLIRPLEATARHAHDLSPRVVEPPSGLSRHFVRGADRRLGPFALPARRPAACGTAGRLVCRHLRLHQRVLRPGPAEYRWPEVDVRVTAARSRSAGTQRGWRNRGPRPARSPDRLRAHSINPSAVVCWPSPASSNRPGARPLAVTVRDTLAYHAIAD